MKHIIINYSHKLEKKNKKIHNLDTDFFVLSVNSSNIIKDLKNLNDLIDFINLNKALETNGNKN